MLCYMQMLTAGIVKMNDAFGEFYTDVEFFHIVVVPAIDNSVWKYDIV